MPSFDNKNLSDQGLPRAGGPIELDPSVYYDRPGIQNKSEKFLVFSLNEKLYAIPSGKIAEVTHPLPIAPLPGTHDWFLGLANLRGEIIAAINLKRLWNESNTALSDKAKLIVLRGEEFETAVAFQVEKLNEIVTLFESEIRLPDKDDPAHVVGVVSRESDDLHLLDPAGITSSLVFD